MKQSLLLVVIAFFIYADEQNVQLCLNTSSNFGTTHFIVGYKDNQFIDKSQDTIDTSHTIVNTKRTSKELSRKKQNNGAELIDSNRTTQSFFTTIHDISDILLQIISQAQKSLYIATFNLTDQRIANLIVEKHKNGVDVCIIVDAGNMKQMHSKIQYLINNNICVLSYDPSLNPLYKKNGLSEPLMHHKCIIVDDEIVITGSANLTKAAQKNNVENINILRDKEAVKEHCQERQRLKKYCTECTLSTKNSK